jgi:hypothetical protein
MLKITPKTLIKIVVEGFIPGDLDEQTAFDFVATWDVVSSSQQEKILDGKKETKQVLLDHLKDLEGVSDEAGKPIKFSADLIDTLYEIIPVRNALIRSFHACQTVEGRKALKAKN